ncbi:selenof [Scenedesmus sp. PABB004]|nr:selenof [Scenedesmus sp. PABB004]
MARRGRDRGPLALQALLLLAAAHAALALSSRECEELGFTGLQSCSDCESMAEFVKDEELTADCKRCCVADADDAGAKYVSARLEVCPYRLNGLPHIKDFIDKHAARCKGQLKVIERVGSYPTLTLVGAGGEKKSALVDNWRVPTIHEFLAKLEPAAPKAAKKKKTKLRSPPPAATHPAHALPLAGAMLPLAASPVAGGRAGPLRAAAAVAAAAAAAEASGGDRALHVLAWGRNAELQCAVEGGLPIVARPTPVLELHGLPVLGLAAGPLSSAAVAGAAGAWTWGDGAAGALGHGSAGRVAAPCRVEALAGGRAAALRGVSLGHSHTLFFDAAGALWACGEGKEGQLGLSQPLQELAAQHRRAWAQAQLPGGALPGRRPGVERAAQLLRAAAPEPAGHVAQGWGSLAGPGGGGQARQQLAAALQSGGGWARSAARRGWPPASLGGGLFGGGSGADLGMSLGAWGGGADLETHLHGVGLQPGQYGTPARVGAGSCASLLGLGERGGGGGGASAAAEDEEASLGAEVVVDAAAGKFFSVLRRPETRPPSRARARARLGAPGV